MALLLTSAVVGVFGTEDPGAPFTATEVAERPRRATGIRVSAVEAASACRGAVKEGLVRRLADGENDEPRYQLTAAGHALRTEINALSKQLLSAFARRISQLLPQYGTQGAGHIRFNYMKAMDLVVVDLVLKGEYRVDSDINGVVANLEQMTDGALVTAVATVPSKYRAAVERLLRLTVSGDDAVLQIALAHVTGVRFCELAACGRLQHQLTAEDLERLGGLTVIEETSALVKMAETPARLAEGTRCLIECIRAGHHVVVLLASVLEYLNGLGDAVERLSTMVHDMADTGGDPRWMGRSPWWVARAAAKYGVLVPMLIEAERCGSEPRLPMVVAFIERLRGVPGVLSSCGVRFIDAESVSEERSRQWRSEVANAKNVSRSDPRAVHDAKLLETVQAMRQQQPLVFVVSTDASLRSIWFSTMGPQALAQIPITCRPGVASRIIAGLTPTTPFVAPWPKRSATWAFAAAHVPRLVAGEAGPVDLFDDDAFLIADDGPFDDATPAGRWEQLHELVDDARLAVLSLADVLERAEQDSAEPLAAEPPTVASDEPVVEHPLIREASPLRTDPDPEPRIPRDRTESFVLVLSTFVVTLLASAFGADDLLQDRINGLTGNEVVAVFFGAVAWVAAVLKCRRTSDGAALVFDLVATALAVLGVTVVV